MPKTTEQKKFKIIASIWPNGTIILLTRQKKHTHQTISASEKTIDLIQQIGMHFICLASTMKSIHVKFLCLLTVGIETGCMPFTITCTLYGQAEQIISVRPNYKIRRDHGDNFI